MTSKWFRKSDLAGPMDPGYYRDPKVPDLRIQVRDTKTKGRTKSWVLLVEIDGQATHIGLGSYPAVSSEEAQRRAWAARTRSPPVGTPAAGTAPPFSRWAT